MENFLGGGTYSSCQEPQSTYANHLLREKGGESFLMKGIWSKNSTHSQQCTKS